MSRAWTKLNTGPKISVSASSLEAGTPESFNVLIKEMQSLGLDVKVGGQAPTNFLENVA